ncbi:hypothetical protein CMI47_01745 [Candidatus Pacearchaeota archaeon]|jgi:hypothetical protein|nr:hypothetical protein [Candidatus Pacearchaeota archaeon]|tara:strand:+ start:901 stop:1125 length:225 start_codon:yes stop_codon:yes gene_type:complete
MINELIKLANYLDSKGLSKEADFLDGIITKVHGKGPDDCGQRLEDEAYYFENLSEMLEDVEEEQEDEAYDMVDT